MWLWPISSSRWCRWALSGANGERPDRVRRTTASSRSTNGTASTANGSSSGSSAGNVVDGGSASKSNCPVRLVTDAASMRPMSIDPLSPMKMRAGLKLWGRKPRHAPASTAAISVGELIRSSATPEVTTPVDSE